MLLKLLVGLMKESFDFLKIRNSSSAKLIYGIIKKNAKNSILFPISRNLRTVAPKNNIFTHTKQVIVANINELDKIFPMFLSMSLRLK